MRVLMTNSKNPFPLASQLYSALQPMDISISSFYPYDLADIYHSSFQKKILTRLLPSHLEDHINKSLVDQIEENSPDLVFIVKGYYITPNTLMRIKQMGIKLVNYNPDHPFCLSGKQNVHNIKNSVPLYDLYISYSKKIQNEILAIYPDLKTAVLPFGYHQNYITNLEESKDYNRVGFIGSADKERAKIIKQIANNGIQIDVYGPSWKKYLSPNANISIFYKIEGSKFYQTLRDYRVQLNLFRKQNYGSHNMRSFEIPAAGGIMLGPFDSDHASFFKDQDYFNFDSIENLVAKVEKILLKPKDEILIMRENIQNKCINEGHSYEHRAYKLIELFSELL